MRFIMRLLTSLALIGVGIAVSFMLIKFSDTVVADIPSVPPTQIAIEKKLAGEAKNWKNLQFELLDPGEAPPELRAMVEVGFRLMLHTHELLPHYIGDKLDCANCHFGGGISTGGVGGGISLAGAAAQYPRYNSRTKSIIDLPTRINSCFKNSMNGKPLPLDSKEMLSLVTYLQWISARYPIYGNAPWLGLKPLRSTHTPDEKEGKKLYTLLCADCHGIDGAGGNPSAEHPTATIPPLWGPSSFNNNAGMNQPEIFATFIYHNMPHDDPHLTVVEALDITAYVLSQPRTLVE